MITGYIIGFFLGFICAAVAFIIVTPELPKEKIAEQRLSELGFEAVPVPKLEIIFMEDMTRELWAKYHWSSMGASYSDPNSHKKLIRGDERMPDAAKKAWDEYEVFMKLHGEIG